MKKKKITQVFERAKLCYNKLFILSFLKMLLLLIDLCGGFYY